MRIGYFGGSFDPPHRGHLAVAHAAAAAFQLDRILLVPTGNQPLKPHGPVAPYADRLAMVSLLCAVGTPALNAGPALIASDLEAPLPDGAPNYTVDTLTKLSAQLAAEDELFVLLGADAFLHLPRWRSPEQLLALADWIIVSRPGFDLTRLAEFSRTLPQGQRIHLLPTLSDPTSATELRSQLAGPREEVRLLEGLPAAILGYIEQHNLYRGTAERRA